MFRKKKIHIPKTTTATTPTTETPTLPEKSLIPDTHYLGPKGYTVPKSALTDIELREIRKDLLVKAFSPPTAMIKPEAFPIYRESPNKIYMPRFYASQRFGGRINALPTRSTIPTGEAIDVPFTGDVRDYQLPMIDAFMRTTRAGGTGCGLLEIPCGRGKCLGRGTPVLLSDGTTKPVEFIVVGEQLMGDDMHPRVVLSLANGRESMYRIEQSNGITYRVNSSHILTLWDMHQSEAVDICVRELVEESGMTPSQIWERYRGMRILSNSAINDVGVRGDIEFEGAGGANMYLQAHPILYSRIQIHSEPEDEYFGFEIDGNRRFLLGDGTITHNTVMALKIISLLKKKTLVIVHKEFLLNQWIERIAQFLPTAKVGRIQAKILDIDGKDIVIGMLQSLSMKDYDDSIFSQFGLTIIDECHHIAAEVFCRALFKIVTPNMLGLSATMNRKDGLTKVFKMFLGDIVYSEKREGGDGVLVRCIQYKSWRPDFNQTILNFKGQPHYSLMISKLCGESHRTELVIKILQDMRKELSSRQIMVLAHNKNVLKYIHDAVESRKIGTVGYYVGGMKEEHLKETESKEIVIATYAMAEEALDIKTLSALVLVTPKTDVTQAVGRILRMKHEFPVVVDIVDPQDIFQRQWKKRRAFYAKCGYTLVETSSDKYLKSSNPLDLDDDKEEDDDDDVEEEEEEDVEEDVEEDDAEETLKRPAASGAGEQKHLTSSTTSFMSDESIWNVIYREGKRAEEFKKKIEDDEKPIMMQGKCFL